jgi:hypothetical protein
MRFVFRWCALVAVLVVANAGCGDDVFGLDDVIGQWETTSINGDAVPGMVVVAGDDYFVEYYRWTFVSAGQCSAEARVDGESFSLDNCDYSVDITQQTITGNSDGLDFAGTVNGDRMDLDFDIVGNWMLRRR